MKLLALAALAAIAVMGAGCSGCSTVEKAVSAVTSDQAVLGSTTLDEKALYDAEAGFYGISVALEAAVDGGYLKGQNAALAAAAYEDAHKALLAARAAYAAGDAKTFTEKIAAGRALVASVWALAPHNTGG